MRPLHQPRGGATFKSTVKNPVAATGRDDLDIIDQALARAQQHHMQAVDG